MDISKFELDNEIKAVFDYVSLTWEGVTPKHLSMIVNESFMAGWNDFRSMYQQSFTTKLEARMSMLSALELPTEVIQSDLLQRVLLSAVIGSLGNDPQTAGSELRIKSLVNSLRSASNAAVSAVRRNDVGPQAGLFVGIDTGDRYARGFATSTSAEQVAYGQSSQQRSALSTLVGAIYAQGAGLREQHNTATLLRDVNTINVAAPLCLEPEALQLPDNPHLRLSLQGAQDTLSCELLQRINWLSPAAQAVDAHP